LALKLHHKFHHVTATCFDSRETLQTKYPHIARTISQIAPENPDTDGEPHASPAGESEWKGFSPSPSPLEKNKRKIDIVYGIDATKLSSTHKKLLRGSIPFTKIVFNFPHVGGLSTDVNRQVRHNQELLVGFFKAAKELLSSPSRPARITSQSEVYESDDEYLSEDLAKPPHFDAGAVNGQILVTLFEGEPYTLWNIRDLARHSGLKVVESFKFPWSAYPGYQHARTIGDITSGKDRNEEGKRKGAWRGEERDARCYVLEDKDAVSVLGQGTASKRKRNEEDDGSE
jgi:25S rRNA (uracil2634-N3)-methyltransferase